MFLLGAVGLIGAGAYAGIQGQSHHDSPADEHPDDSPDGVPSTVEERISAAIKLGQAGDFNGAISGLQEVLRDAPESVDAQYNLGVALIGRGRMEEAEAAFRRVLVLNPGDAGALAELAGLAKEKGQIDAAYGYLEQIPPKAGKIQLRLAEDPLWDDLATDDRMAKLRQKHGLPVDPRYEAAKAGAGGTETATPANEETP
jgi:tetratricopeptide (TPR) repeat protein